MPRFSLIGLWTLILIFEISVSCLSQPCRKFLPFRHVTLGSPLEHRTDSLSAAYRNLGGRTNEDLTQMYQRLCQHYGIRPTRNNLGKSHENSAIESSHRHFKNRLRQALLLRGSHDFASPAAYQQLINAVVERLNLNCSEKFAVERQHLQPLPAYRSPTMKFSVSGSLLTALSRYAVFSTLCHHG